MNADLTNEVANVMACPYASYHEPLRVARQWNRGGSADELEAATALLAGLRTRYPTALRVWYEGAFNLMQRGLPAEALRLLTEMDRRFGGRLDADTHALFGRHYKEAGHGYLDAALKVPADVPERASERTTMLERSDRGYVSALAQYERGYGLDHNWFPGINTAFLLFMRGALAVSLLRPADSDRLLAAARARAAELLAAAPEWPTKLPDDEVWHAATRAEAHALRDDWAEAVRHYRTATDWTGLQDHHKKSMGKQLRRILQGYELLSPSEPAAPVDLAAQLPKLAPFLPAPAPGVK